MANYSDQAQRLLLVIRSGKFAALANEFRKRLYSNKESYLLRRDLSVPFHAAPPKQPIEIRAIRDSDLPAILEARPGRLAILRANIPTCYLAVTANGAIAYMQWMVAQRDIDRFKPFFDGQLSDLRADEVLLEFAYTFEQFRGQKIMGAAMASIAEKALLNGARYAITFVQRDNIAAIKGCASAGFFPYLIREERWRLFKFKETFRSLPAPNSATPDNDTQTVQGIQAISKG
jgi:GNAT superfamily N-acetyltransferase